MERYRVIGLMVSFISGIIDLTPAQAASRITALQDLGDGLYNIIAPIQFKHGEEFGYDGEINKLLLQNITVVDESADKESAEDPDESIDESADEASGDGEEAPQQDKPRRGRR